MKKYLLTIAVALMTAFAFTACSSDDDDSPAAPKDVSVTASADVKDYSSVVLKGYAYGANGKVGFCYSETDKAPKPESSNVVETSSLKSDNSYELTVDGLKPKTTYYYRAYATKDGMKMMAKDVKTFTTEEFKAKAVDLGLSVKWANCNVGATAPEYYGDYFAWGETSPKTTYDWNSYKWCNGSSTTMTKYCTSLSYGTVDNKTTIDLSDDAARANWGGSWRMPTNVEQDELRTKCTWTWTTQNGVSGYKVVGPNGNSIFLPAAGYRGAGSLYDAGSYGYYWSSSLLSSFSDGAYYLGFRSSGVGSNGIYRYGGLSVRAVCQ